LAEIASKEGGGKLIEILAGIARSAAVKDLATGQRTFNNFKIAQACHSEAEQA